MATTISAMGVFLAEKDQADRAGYGARQAGLPFTAARAAWYWMRALLRASARAC